MARLLAALIVLNIADGALTVSLLSSGAEEVNPLLRAAWLLGPWALLAAKAALVVPGLGILWTCRRSSWASRSTWAVIVIYSAVVLWQLAGLALAVHGL